MNKNPRNTRGGTMKIPANVIIKSLQDELRALKEKNHEIVLKAKEREEHWKAHVEHLNSVCSHLREDLNDQEKRAVMIKAKAINRANELHQQLLAENRALKQQNEALRTHNKELVNELENRPVGEGLMPRGEVRKAFNKLTNRRQIMDALGYPYNESIQLAHNAVLFLEWVRMNRLWVDLYDMMEKFKKK